ncbi:MAG: hypothetical protein ACK515_02535 [bacterium]
MSTLIPYDRPSRDALAARLELSERTLRRYMFEPLPAWLRLAIKALQSEAVAKSRPVAAERL